MKKVFIVLAAVTVFSFLLTGCETNKNDKLTIISTSFPGYDFARAITKGSEDIDVKMLIKPGSEIHDFEPTPQDIINIKKSDIFIYVGGESDNWVSDILNDVDTDRTKIIKLMDLVTLKEEETVLGMEAHEEETEYDEHVWTSPINAIKIISELKDEIIKIDVKNKNMYEKNTNNYINDLTDIDNEIRSLVSNAQRREIIFGDRFPIRYFADEYGLSYYAAFPGCSEQTEASAKTISFLIDKVKEDKVPAVFYIELSGGKIAKAIADETGAKVLEFNSAHNISQKDFDAEITYLQIMKKNINVLKEALN